MTDDFRTRPASAADVPALVALVNSAFRGDSSRAGWTTEADLLGGIRVDETRLLDTVGRSDQVILVHEEDGAIVSCVHLQRLGAGTYLGMLTTKPTLQGQGLGRRTVEAAEAWAISTWQSREIHMTVIVQRPELVAWYERLGYVATGVRKPFPYGDKRYGIPTRPDLEFEVLKKSLANART